MFVQKMSPFFYCMKTVLLKAKMSVGMIVQWKICPTVNEVHDGMFGQLCEVSRSVSEGCLMCNNGLREK